MKMGKQEEREMEMLLEEIHATSPHLYPIHGDAFAELPPQNSIFGCGGAAVVDGESPSYARHNAYIYGRGFGSGGGDGHACLSPPAHRSDASSSSGSGSLSDRLSSAGTAGDEFIMENFALLEKLQDTHLGVDEKAPVGLPSVPAVAVACRERKKIAPSLFHADYDTNFTAEVPMKDAYLASTHSFLPDSLLFDVDKRAYVTGIERHCAVNADFREPWIENSPYKAAGFGRDGFLSRNSCYLGVYTVGASLYSEDFLQPDNGVDLNRGYNLLDSSKLNDNSSVLNGFPGSPDNLVAAQPPSLMKNLGEIDSIGFDDGLILQGKDFERRWVDLLKERKRSEFCNHLTSHGVPVKLDFSPALLLNNENVVDIKGCIYNMAKDQKGCRFLQRKFVEGKHQVDMIFDGVIDHVVELMVHPFGNYLVQKLLEACSEQQRTDILIVLTANPADLVRISLNMHGTRAVQKLIDTLKTRQQVALVISALRPGFQDLIKDSNGNHVVKHCLESFTAEENEFIFDAAAKHCVDIATHRHGCCVLQRCIDHSTREHQAKLISEISANGLELAQDPFGNYVVQYILKLKSPLAIAKLASQFKGKYVLLSVQKYSSNVVEKCLKYFGEGDRATIIVELLSFSDFKQLLQDQYANYVIQSALQNSKGSLHATLIEAIRPHAAVLKSSPHCKRIFSRGLLKR